MVDVWVTEYRGIDSDGQGRVVPAKREPAIQTTKKTVSGTDTFTLNSETRIVQIYADAIIYINFEEAADGNDEPVPSETVADRLIRADSFGTLYVSDGS